jgi:predicted dinucleotide-binding enzyme
MFMTTTTSYSIIGSGNVGSALARLFARARIDVTIANTRGPGSLGELVDELGPAVQPGTIADAVDRDVILLAIPFHTVADFGRTLPSWAGKTVVDATNSFYTPNAEELLQGRLSSEYVADSLPGGTIVKAFNQLPADVLGGEVPPAHGRRVMFVASNDDAGSALVAGLVNDLGLAPIELGRIDDGGRLIQAQNALVLRPLIEQSNP